jgi:branched-subunit amino acid transport protein
MSGGTHTVTWLIVALAAGTLFWRLLPLATLSRTSLPRWAEEWLRLVPGAILAASLAQSLLVQGDRLALTWRNPYLLAALPAFLVAWRTRNVLLTMVCGMAGFVASNYVLQLI